MVRVFEASDEGMAVRTTDGELVGHVEEVRGNTAYVRPEAGLTESIRQRLGWESKTTETFTLTRSQVERFEDDGIYLSG